MKLDYVARPAGTKPVAVYWRRRLVVLGTVLLLVWFAAKACGGSGSSRAAGDTQAAKSRPSAVSSTHSASRPHGSAPSAAAIGAPGDTAANSSGALGSTAPAAATQMCDGSTLSLRAAVDRLSLRRPFTAGITLQIATRSPSPCGLDASALQAQVLNGSQVLWSSNGCPSAGTSTSGTAANGPAAGTSSASGAGTNSSSSTSGVAQNLITVPSQSAADQHYTWQGNVCSGQLAPGRYDVVGRLGLAQAFAGTVTVS